MKLKIGKNEYYINCDNNANVTLKIKIDRKKIKNENGVKVETDEYIYDVLGYFNTIEQCFGWFLNYLIKQKGKSNKVDGVESILEAIKEAKEEILNEVKNITV